MLDRFLLMVRRIVSDLWYIGPISTDGSTDCLRSLVDWFRLLVVRLTTDSHLTLGYRCVSILYFGGLLIGVLGVIFLSREYTYHKSQADHLEAQCLMSVV